jgi:hypothetical protein
MTKPKSRPLTLTKPEADALANVGMIAALQLERGGYDVADLWRAVKKVAAVKHEPREIEIPEERLKILDQGE